MLLHARLTAKWDAMDTGDVSIMFVLVMMDGQEMVASGRSVQMIATTMGIVETVHACARTGMLVMIADALQMKPCHTSASNTVHHIASKHAH